MTSDYYDSDLPSDASLISLEIADAILATTLHGFTWTARADEDRRACTDNLERQPARDLDKAALQDASAIMGAQQWRGRRAVTGQPQPFPRTGLSLPHGFVVSGIPADVRRATAILAAMLVAKSEHSMSPEVFRSYQIGEVRGEFRTPARDDLPPPVRQLVAAYLDGGAAWVRVRP